jgi:hypothetical protein
MIIRKQSANVAMPTRNANPVFLAASERIIRTEVEAGLPAH